MVNENVLQALDVIEDGLLIINKDYIVEYANEPAKRLLRQDELVGKHSYEAIWARGDIVGKTPCFMSFDTKEITSAERCFDDGTCLSVRCYPLDEQHVVVTVWNISDYITLERRLESAGTDSVTGLKSGNTFAEDLEKELDRAKRLKSTLALMMLEIDIISGSGEDSDEKILKNTAGIIIETARSYDIAYRFKGKTFGILMPHCPVDGATKTAERLLDKIKSGIPNINLSIGISTSESAFTGRDILRLAERALYVAQHRGGNTVVVG